MEERESNKKNKREEEGEGHRQRLRQKRVVTSVEFLNHDVTEI